MFDKRVLRKILIIIVLISMIITAFFGIRETLSKYQSEAKITAKPEIAFWIVDDTIERKNIHLTELYPSKDRFEFDLCQVSNFKDGKRAETMMQYYFVLTVTTNIPLEYEVVKDGSVGKNTEEIIQDEDGTFYRRITMKNSNNMPWTLGVEEDITESFKMYVTFPEIYKNDSNLADLIESARLEIDAKQLVEGEAKTGN